MQGVERGRRRRGMGVRIKRVQCVPGELIARLQGLDHRFWFHGDLPACHAGEVETGDVAIVGLCLGWGLDLGLDLDWSLRLGGPRTSVIAGHEGVRGADRPRLTLALALRGAALPGKFQNRHGQLFHVFPQVDR